MLYSKIEPRSDRQVDIHAAHCGCRDCHAINDPIGYARKCRVLRTQAIVLGLFLLTIYGLVALNWHGIAASFGAGTGGGL